MALWLVVIPQAAAAGTPAATCPSTGFDGVRILRSRIPAPERVADGQPASARWSAFERVTDAILGTADPERRSVLLGAMAAGTTADIPCDRSAMQRDQLAYRLALVGYSADEVARMLLGESSRAEIDAAYIRKITGRPPLPIERWLAASPTTDRTTVLHLPSLGRTIGTLVPTPADEPAAALGGAAPGAAAPIGASLDAWVLYFSSLYDVDYRLVRAVIDRESSWQPSATSAKGAHGLMQLMPATAAMLGVNPRDPVDNLRGGIAYLGQLIREYGDVRAALIAYNAGPEHANQVLRGETALFRETREFLQAIAATYPLD